MRRQISAHVDGGLSGVSSVRRHGSEDPHLQEQDRRKMVIENVCKEHYPDLYFDNVPLVDNLWDEPRTLASFFSYLPEQNILFCGVPKCGTTTWVEGRVSIRQAINFMIQGTKQCLFYIKFLVLRGSYNDIVLKCFPGMVNKQKLSLS